jgi:hypothetical protein
VVSEGAVCPGRLWQMSPLRAIMLTTCGEAVEGVWCLTLLTICGITIRGFLPKLFRLQPKHACPLT